MAHLVECKRTADHGAGEPLTSFGIGGLVADAVVDGEARVYSTFLSACLSDTGLAKILSQAVKAAR